MEVPETTPNYHLPPELEPYHPKLIQLEFMYIKHYGGRVRGRFGGGQGGCERKLFVKIKKGVGGGQGGSGWWGGGGQGRRERRSEDFVKIKNINIL